MTLLMGEDRARGSTLAKCWLMWCCWRRCLSVGGRRREGSWAASWAGASCAFHLLARKSLPVLVRPMQHPAALTGHGRVACESLTDTERYAGTIPPPSSLGRTDGSVTLVEGQTFCVSDRTGDVCPNQPHGLFVLDTRVLSRWELLIDGHPLESLTVDVPEPFTALFVGRALPPAGQVDSDVIAFRDRAIGQGLRERIAVTNYGTERGGRGDRAAVRRRLRRPLRGEGAPRGRAHRTATRDHCARAGVRIPRRQRRQDR